MKETVLFLLTLLLLSTPSLVLAAPETAVALAESSAVNLPGILGAILAVIALLLPFTLRAWIRHNWKEQGK